MLGFRSYWIIKLGSINGPFYHVIPDHLTIKLWNGNSKNIIHTLTLMADNSASEKQCRICLDGEDPLLGRLICPCRCSGSIAVSALFENITRMVP